MKKISFSFKRAFCYSVASVFTFINFLAFLISRNNAWVQNPGRAWQYASATEFRDYPASAFERTLSCYGLGQCENIGGALIMQPINYFADILSKIYFWNLDDQSRIFNIQMVGFGWRIACLFFIAFVVFRSFRDVFFALFFLNALLFALSGWMLRMLGKVIEILPIEFTAEFKSRSVLAFQDFPHENLEWYDFGLFAILAIIAVIVPRLSKSRFSIVKTILVGVLFTSFFEYLGFVLAISWILFNVSNKASTLIGKKSFQIGTLVGFGSMIWFISINFYRRFMQATYPKFFNSEGASTGEYYKSVFWAIRHPIENLTSNPSIPFQIILVISQSALMGIILGLVARKIFRLTNFDSKLVMLFKFITIATGIVMFINFFVAYGVEVQATEHSRQTLGLQIALFTYLFLQTASSKKIDKLVGANN
jgi:hypothetical protein